MDMRRRKKMDLIKSTNDRYEEYEALLLERDQLRKEAGQIWTCYVQTFGQLMTDVYETKIECIKRKKTISYYQSAINHGGVVDPDAMQQYLNHEMAAYYTNLKRMIEDNERCKDAGYSTPYEVQRSKTLYRRLAKLLHPDINPETDRQDVLKELWQRILTAYAHNDIKALSELDVLVRKTLKDLGSEEIRADIPDIDERIDSLKTEIHEITHTDPYTYGPLLDDPEAVEKKKSELTNELETWRNYLKELEKIIHDTLNSGGITLQWRMN